MGVGSGIGAAHAQTPTFSLSPQTQNVDLSAGHVQVTVQISGATNVAAFEFRLRYDPGVLSNPTVQAGPFLAALSPQCPDALVDVNGEGHADPGTVDFGCATIGVTAGESGSGALATVTFQLAGGDQTSVALEHLSATGGPPADDNECASGCAAQNGSITVNGGDPSKDHGLSSTPTPIPQQENPAPTSTPVQPPATTVPGSTAVVGTTQGAGSTPASGGSGSGATSGAAGSGAAPGGTVAGASSGSTQRTGTGVGKFGYGPQPADRRGAKAAFAAALTMALLGVALLASSAAVRWRWRGD